MTRETLYVAMSRGRAGNHAYICTDTPHTEPHQRHEPPTARTVIAGVLARTGAELSAHDAIAAEQDRHGGIAQLAAEYETIASAAQRRRWTELIRTCGLTDEQAEEVVTSDAFGPLTAALRRADAHGLTPERLLPPLITDRPLEDADDIAAVMHHRLDTAVLHHQQTTNARRSDLIVGLIPAASGPMTADMHTALQQRQHLIQRRAIDVLRTALENDEPWVRHLGPPPADVGEQRAWARHAATVAAYRDRYAVATDTPIGTSLRTASHRADAAAADSAARKALAISQVSRLTPATDGWRPPSRQVEPRASTLTPVT